MRGRSTDAGLLTGTPAYLAPEQALGADLGPPADLYALGAVLYEMLTGRHVFGGETIAAIVAQHVLRPPTRPSTFNTEVPAALEELVLRLLEKDARDRPQTAEEVSDVLTQLATESHRRPRPAIRALREGFFVGRDAELNQLREAFNRTSAGRGGGIFVAGEPGGGKTSTIHEFLKIVKLAGGRAVSVRCHEGSGTPAFWPWIQILRNVLGPWRTDPDLAVVSRLDASVLGALILNCLNCSAIRRRQRRWNPPRRGSGCSTPFQPC